jgi:hypothetical protein
MKLQSLAVVATLTALLGAASGQAPPPPPQAPVDRLPGQPESTLPPLPPSPKVLPPGTELLQGNWRVTLTDHDAFKEYRLSFDDQTLTVMNGVTKISVPFEVKSGKQQYLLTFRIFAQQWTAGFNVLDGEVLTLRLNQPAEAGQKSILLVLEKKNVTTN